MKWGEEGGRQNNCTPKMSTSYVIQNPDAHVTCNQWICYLHGKRVFEDMINKGFRDGEINLD